MPLRGKNRTHRKTLMSSVSVSYAHYISPYPGSEYITTTRNHSLFINCIRTCVTRAVTIASLGREIPIKAGKDIYIYIYRQREGESNEGSAVMKECEASHHAQK